jgi:hypothetical protein
LIVMRFKVRRVIFTHSEHRGLKFHPSLIFSTVWFDHSLIFSTVRGAVLFALLSASGVVLKKMRLGSGVEKNGATGEVALRQLGRRTKTSEILHQLQNVFLYKIRQNDFIFITEGSIYQ